MCLFPVTIINPTKYVSVRYRDRFLMQVPCGKCAECMTNKSNEWNFRLYQQALQTYKNRGFVYFATLTYNNKFLPHISDYLSVPKEVDFPCFRSEDVRLFVAALRQKCKRSYKSNFEYFIASEYGTNERCTHRPHYHAIFFVHGDITNYQFSRLVADYWIYGRTDSYPYKSMLYVEKNTFRDSSSDSLAALRYVTKYIQKSCEFQGQINSRVSKILDSVVERFEKQGLENWRESSHYWRVYEKLMRKFNQFHRQSTHLGESYLDKLDVGRLFDDPFLYMPDSKAVIKKIPLPTYYKRKLFYQQIEQDGAKLWIPNEVGYQFLDYRLGKIVDNVALRLQALGYHVGKVFDYHRLADYILNYRGRFFADFVSEFSERISNIDYYAYVNRYDREAFDQVGLSHKWCGNSVTGYVKRCPFVTLRDFIKTYVYMDEDLEAVIDELYSFSEKLDAEKQKAFETKQRTSNIIHYLIEK